MRKLIRTIFLSAYFCAATLFSVSCGGGGGGGSSTKEESSATAIIENGVYRLSAMSMYADSFGYVQFELEGDLYQTITYSEGKYTVTQFGLVFFIYGDLINAVGCEENASGDTTWEFETDSEGYVTHGQQLNSSCQTANNSGVSASDYVLSSLGEKFQKVSNGYKRSVLAEVDGEEVLYEYVFQSINEDDVKVPVEELVSSDVTKLYGNGNSVGGSFGVLKSDGTVVTWGEVNFGGDSHWTSNFILNVKSVHPSEYGYSVIYDDGSVESWGNYILYENKTEHPENLSGVIDIVTSSAAYAAIDTNGKVTTWGVGDRGGDSSAVSSALSSGVSEIVSNDYGFAALKDDGSVVSWGSSEVSNTNSIAGDLVSGVSKVFSTIPGTGYGAFAALKDDGSVVTWGKADEGGDSSSVSSDISSNVVSIVASYEAFAALKSDGSVVTWGSSGFGGSSSSVSSDLTSGVDSIATTGRAFAALKNDGSVITWGFSDYGGDSSSVSGELSSGVVSVDAIGEYLFKATKSNGDIVLWGHPDFIGNVPDDVKDAFVIRWNYDWSTDTGAYAYITSAGVFRGWGSQFTSPPGTITGVASVKATFEYGVAVLKDDGSVEYWLSEEAE